MLTATLWFSVPVALFILFQLAYLACGATNNEKHFLSLFVRFKNEAETILEFMQHYMEEGVEHFFMYDDWSYDGTLEALKCLPGSLFELHNNASLGIDSAGLSRIPLDKIFEKYYASADIPSRTEWLIIVDIDEFITSRASPQLTIKDILGLSSAMDCAVFGVPTLMYSWGGLTHTTRNNARYVLHYRWGYDEKFAVNVTEKSAFRNRHVGTRNSVILRTNSVQSYRGVYGTELLDQDGGTVCVPRANGRMACAAELSDSRVESYSAVKQSPLRNRGKYYDIDGKNRDLPRWCPYSNALRSSQIPAETLMLEDDINSMQLVTFHYRVRSLQDWNRKSMHKRGSHHEANRLDVFDDFMTSVRRPAKTSHPSFLAAAKQFEKCSAKFYDKEDVIPAVATQIAPPEVQAAVKPASGSSEAQLLLQKHIDSALEYEFFFSVMVFAKDESGVILELMKHYIEEGADHIFLFDDDSEDGMGGETLECVDPKYYTVYNRTFFESERRYTQQEGYMLMYVNMQVRHRTKWLAVVDADEFISSRAHPQMTIKELLQSQLSDCGIISIPWILFSWGNQTADPHNQFRETLFYRMGYDEKYSLNAPDGFKFRERWNGESNKVIFQTAKVSEYRLTHHARFTDEENGGLVCIPSTDSMLKCAADLGDALDLDAFRAAVVSPDKIFEDIHGSNQSLPAYCPYSTRYIGTRSTYRTFINEQDIPKLVLACSHYRVKSQEDWKRKTAGQRFNSWEYDEQDVRFANRLDIFDAHMLSERKPSRASHPDYIKAQVMFRRCPTRYFGPQSAASDVTSTTRRLSDAVE